MHPHLIRIAFLLCLAFPGLTHAIAPPDTIDVNAVYRDTFCENQTLIIGNMIFDASNPSGTVVFPGGASTGGDSILEVDLRFFQPVEIDLNQSLCYGDTLYVNGTGYHANFYLGREVVENGSFNGCDSIINIELTFTEDNVYPYNATFCEFDTVFVNGTAYYNNNSSGEERIVRNGCDSIILVEFEFVPAPFTDLRDTLCPDSFLIINGNRYDTNNRGGVEILKNASFAGCDSLIYIELGFYELWVYIGEDTEITLGDEICIEPLYGLSPTNIQWFPTPPCDEPDCLDYCIQPLDNAAYSIEVTDQATGCILSDNISILVNKENRVYAPTVFNPDASFPNDRFFLSCDEGVSNITRLLIADRWGAILFDQENLMPDDPNIGWDGRFNDKVVQTGVFTWWAEFERLDGTVFQKSGGVAVVR